MSTSVDEYDDLESYNWLHEQVDFHETPQAMALGALLIDLIMPRSVIDVGCSSGIYLVSFRLAGCDVHGIDGSSAAGEHLHGPEFELVDLRNPWTPARQYDLALCIEVAEHLRPEYAAILIETLASCSDTIYFSAAKPGQGGVSHYNEQTKQYWLDLFSIYGIGKHPLSDQIQSIIDREEPFAHCSWLRWNGMLMTK